MALMPRLEARQSQSLSLTPQLMQSIRLLQLSHLELNAFVELELERNPLIEREEAATGDELPAESDEIGDSEGIVDAYENVDRVGNAASIADSMDTDVANVFPEQVGQDSIAQSTATRAEIRGLGSPADNVSLETYVATEVTLADQLIEQAGWMLQSPAERLIARHLIDNLNEAGYLAIACSEVADQLGTETERVETVLQSLQRCDPPGLFARDVGECLALQLRERDRLDPLMEKLLANLDLVADHNIPALCRAVGTDREDILDMLSELRTLDPRPGRAFDTAPIQAIVPDIFVRRGPDGAWQIELNTDILPRVLVNRTYYAQIVKKTRAEPEKRFLVDCMQTANWLTKSLDQRAQTILKVATEIVRQQEAFLINGVEALRPMTLRMVADEIDAHESTVSRVTSNKYMSTPRGLLELKYFFTTALSATDGGDEHSAEAVRHVIRQLIDAETPAAILSDDTIADLLKNRQGIEVARRTVAKYREAMNIPSSVVRRRQKKAEAEYV